MVYTPVAGYSLHGPVNVDGCRLLIGTCWQTVFGWLHVQLVDRSRALDDVRQLTTGFREFGLPGLKIEVIRLRMKSMLEPRGLCDFSRAVLCFLRIVRVDHFKFESGKPDRIHRLSGFFVYPHVSA